MGRGFFPLLLFFYMRLNCIFLLLLCHSICFSQKATGVEVEYQEFHEVNAFHTFITFYAALYADNDTAIYKTYDDSQFSEEQPFNKDEARPSNPENIRNFSGNYIKTDTAKKELLLIDQIIGNKFLVKDIYPQLNWEINNETKSILGYKCHKATTEYRGRKWTAWFSPEIAIKFGPRKLHGLPGLILEAYDSKDEVTYKAVKVITKDCDICNKDFTTLVKTRNSKPISYQQFLSDRKEAFDNLNKKVQSENPDISSADLEGGIPRTGPELKYEWEE